MTCCNFPFPGGSGLAGTRMSPVWILLKQDEDGGGGGDNWSYKLGKTPAKLSLSAIQHPVFFQVGCPTCCPTSSVKALKGKYHIPSSPGGVPTLSLTTNSFWREDVP